MVWKGKQEQDIVSELFIPKNTAVKLDTVQIDEANIHCGICGKPLRTKVFLSCLCGGTEFKENALAVGKL